MLKIKDNVNLKDLEKYGFNTRASSEVNGFDLDFTDSWIDDNFGMIHGHGWVV